jgi:hypothetical protein
LNLLEFKSKLFTLTPSLELLESFEKNAWKMETLDLNTNLKSLKRQSGGPYKSQRVYANPQ